jgi:ribosomal protein S18 acetylase RimI-like enzyme
MSRTEITDQDREDVAAFIRSYWKSDVVMSRGRKFYPHQERGFIERRNGAIVGLVTFHIEADGMEILTHNAVLEGQRIGTSLMLEAIDKARHEGSPRVWLTTTNANLRAIGFYQRLGFRMIAINVGVVDEARRIKPEIPEAGEGGIPIHDEIVLELKIQPFLDPA